MQRASIAGSLPGRPPIATERLSQLEDGRLELRLKRPWRDGTTAFVFTPHELIERLVTIAVVEKSGKGAVAEAPARSDHPKKK